MTIKQGCILWNKKDFVGCTSLYRSLAMSYAQEYPVLAEALISCENAPLDNGCVGGRVSGVGGSVSAWMSVCMVG